MDVALALVLALALALVIASSVVVGVALFLCCLGCCFSCYAYRRDRLAAANSIHRVDPDPPAGLTPAELESLPTTFVYTSGGGDCSVCLDRLEGQRVRFLPGCGHLFHAGCIDQWLLCTTSSPLCRSTVKPGSPPRGDHSSPLPLPVLAGDELSIDLSPYLGSEELREIREMDAAVTEMEMEMARRDGSREEPLRAAV